MYRSHEEHRKVRKYAPHVLAQKNPGCFFLHVLVLRRWGVKSSDLSAPSSRSCNQKAFANHFRNETDICTISVAYPIANAGRDTCNAKIAGFSHSYLGAQN